MINIGVCIRSTDECARPHRAPDRIAVDARSSGVPCRREAVAGLGRPGNTNRYCHGRVRRRGANRARRRDEFCNYQKELA